MLVQRCRLQKPMMARAVALQALMCVALAAICLSTPAWHEINCLCLHTLQSGLQARCAQTQPSPCVRRSLPLGGLIRM